MKIALLNLQYDNNYGGNLQRYALMTVLQRMGHDVTHLNLRFNFITYPWHHQCYLILRRLLSRIFKRNGCAIFPEYRRQQEYMRSCAVTDVFYNKYIKHTKPIYSKKELQKYQDFDAFIVGSDQVWRKTIAAIYGITTFFFDYLPVNNMTPRIAYGVSLGTGVNELNEEDLAVLTPLYRKFKAVSVREDSALKLFTDYVWDQPSAQQVLDPTLLLCKEDYSQLINQSQTDDLPGNLFCYILDMTDEKRELIRSVEKEKGLNSFVISLNNEQPSVEQWLRYFRDSEYIITDSFHGLVYSTIFNKPFLLINNEFRGNARLESLIRMLYCGTSIDNPNWLVVNENIEGWRNKSLVFLQNHLRNS